MVSDRDCTCTFDDFIDGKCEMENDDILNTCNFSPHQQLIVKNNSIWKKYSDIFTMLITSLIAIFIGITAAYTEWWVFNISISIVIAMLGVILFFGFSRHIKIGIASAIIAGVSILLIWIFNRTNWINNGLDLSHTHFQIIKPLTIDYLYDVFMYIGIIVVITIIGALVLFASKKLLEKYGSKKIEEIAADIEKKSEEENPALNSLQDYSTLSVILLFILLPVAAVSEEIIFRWFWMNMLYNMGFSLGWIIIIASICFGLGHPYGIDDFLVTAFLGMLLSFIFIDWGILGSGIVHLGWNLVAIFSEYAQSKDTKKAIKKTLVFGFI